MPFLSVVIPCFNEEGNIPALKETLPPLLDALRVDWEVVCVNDGSTDGTAAALAALSAADPRFRVATHESNRGLGAAIITGLASAQGEWIATLDADLSFPPEQLADLLRRQKETGADCVGGSPILGQFEGVPTWRQIPSKMMNRLYGFLFDPALSAYTPLFRLYRAALVKDMALIAVGFEINAEIYSRLVRKGARIAEMPATLRTRKWGSSKLRYVRELKRHARLLWKLHFS